jgi:hypothetical protein
MKPDLSIQRIEFFRAPTDKKRNSSDRRAARAEEEHGQEDFIVLSD